MFDVYLNDRRAQLLVVAKGQPIPIHRRLGRWRRRKAAVTVSDEIKMAVQRTATIRADYESLKDEEPGASGNEPGDGRVRSHSQNGRLGLAIASSD